MKCILAFQTTKFLKWPQQWWLISFIALFTINADLIMVSVFLLLITNKAISSIGETSLIFIFYIGLKDTEGIICVVQGPVTTF